MTRLADDIASLLAGFFLGAALCVVIATANKPAHEEPAVITQVRTDTVVLREPVADTVLVRKPVYIRIPADSVRVVQKDTVEIPIPMEQKIYSDSTFKAYISGYKPHLDSIFVVERTKVVTERYKPVPKYWHVGPSIGVGLTPEGAQPYIGISVTYSLFSF